jgi:hypothetical protein
MSRPNFLNSEEDMIWLFETHLITSQIPFRPKSAVLYGNEDCPDEMLIWDHPNPNYHEPPRVGLLQDDGNYRF